MYYIEQNSAGLKKKKKKHCHADQNHLSLKFQGIYLNHLDLITIEFTIHNKIMTPKGQCYSTEPHFIYEITC